MGLNYVAWSEIKHEMLQTYIEFNFLYEETNFVFTDGLAPKLLQR